MNIKTIIFDNNGVLVASGYEGGHRKISDFLKVEFEIFLPVWRELVKPLDDGSLTTKELYQKVMEAFNVDGDIFELEKLHLKSYAVKEEMHSFAKELKGKYEIALLTNFGDTFDRFNETWQLDKIFEPEKMFVSHKLKMKKPEKEIYLHALKELGREAEECIFIDDREENVVAALNLGMNAILFENLEKLKTDLREHVTI